MAIALLAGNSKYINSDTVKEALVKAQWYDKLSFLLVTDSNRVLVEAVKALALQDGFNFEIIAVPWQRSVKQADGSTTIEQNRGALFQTYDTLITKVNAVMCFSTGPDNAVDTLNRNCSNIKVPCIVHKVQPKTQQALTTLMVEKTIDREALKAIAKKKLAQLAMESGNTAGDEPTEFSEAEEHGGTATGNFDGAQETNGHDQHAGWE